ncbi:MAG TPA: UDP-N-acetylmuramoyl-L-alanine--D-glutamate ligase [Candidatus Saccharimonadales bacterium]|nr:UDP-N-acetylmuramoyl-L-alanine--D-glutamate ligase [Candidatus Saccharimonadales bacterium]
MKIAIAGYGIEGEASYRYWSTNPDNQITIVDRRQPDCIVPAGVPTIIGIDAPEKLQGFDLVIRTPRMRPDMIKTDGKIWSITNEFFDKCPATIIGVTGSKGKGTTASLIASILEAAGKRVYLLGNIGKPALDILPQIQKSDIVVYELSSFQLWDMKKSPHIAIVLFIEQEHLNVHLDMGEYVQSKANITKYQTAEDVLIYNKSNKYSQMIADESKAELIGYTDISTAHTSHGFFYYGEQKICSVDSLGIVGKFNHDNACAAIDAIWGITNDTTAIEKGLESFKGLPHRLQLVRELNGVKYYDDSIATIPGAAIAALKAFDAPEVIILGGSSKGSNFTELGEELARHDVAAILIGDEAENIANSCKKAGFKDFEVISYISMNQIVARAKTLAKSGGVVLLSPACASFGLFKNYTDRGELFSAAVNKL